MSWPIEQHSLLQVTDWFLQLGLNLVLYMEAHKEHTHDIEQSPHTTQAPTGIRPLKIDHSSRETPLATLLDEQYRSSEIRVCSAPLAWPPTEK